MLKDVGIRPAEPILMPRVPRHQIPNVTRVRGQWIAASLRAVRERGLLDRYLAKLPSEHHTPIRTTPVHEWLPAHVVVAHYAALDALDLPPEDIESIGASVVIHGHGKAIEVALKVIPLSVFNVFSAVSMGDKLWERAFDGGALIILRLGPKEARMEAVGLPFSHLHYPRVAIRGVITGVMRLMVKTVYVRDLTLFGRSNTLAYRVSWV
jgi:hypothetical protein